MLRVPVHLVHRALFDDQAAAHDRDPVADLPHHGEVVRDEDEGEPEFPLEFREQRGDLGLSGDVQGGDRFVADDEAGPGASARAMPTRWRWPPLNSCG